MSKREEMIKFIETGKVGGTDPNGNEVTFIYSRTTEYIIYAIKSDIPSDRIKSFHASADDKRDQELDAFYSKIRLKFIDFRGMLYKVGNDSSIPIRAAQIVSHGLSGDPDAANKQFDELMKEINKEFRQRFFHRMLLLVFTLALPIISFVVFENIRNNYDRLSHLLEWIQFIGFAACGGFLSVSYRMSRFEFIDDAPFYAYIMFGLERSLVAGLSGLIITLAIRGNLLLGFVEDTNVYVQTILAIAAGFSESLVPTILNDLERNSKVNSPS